jgi:two-component sensor histidine kinase
VNRQKIAEYTQLIRPWSLEALAFALLALVGATAVRAIFAHFGATLYFATYFPIVLVVSVFAGVPAGTITAVLSLLVVWWAFIPPYYAFSSLHTSDFANFLLYGISSALIIWLSHLYRTTLSALLQTQRSKNLLVDELNHRAGNLLTVIQSIVKGTLVSNKQEARRLSGRIEALARADDLVSRTDQGEVLLLTLLQKELAPHARSTQVKLSGPHVVLTGSVTRNVALVLHELTTNSVKHGALSDATGQLDVSWSIADGVCQVRWTEDGVSGGEKPARVGFGSRMIAASIATLDGTIDQQFTNGRYVSELTFSIKSDSKRKRYDASLTD